MMSDLARDLWRGAALSSAPGAVSHRFRQREAELRARSRREMMNSVGLAVVMAGASAYGSYWTDSTLARVSFALAAGWVSAGQYFLHRVKRQAPRPEEAGGRTTLESCRREMERQLRFERGSAWWLQAPLMVAFVTLLGALAGKSMMVKMAPAGIALLAVWAPCVLVFQQVQERKFRRAMAELERER